MKCWEWDNSISVMESISSSWIWWQQRVPKRLRPGLSCLSSISTSSNNSRQTSGNWGDKLLDLWERNVVSFLSDIGYNLGSITLCASNIFNLWKRPDCRKVSPVLLLLWVVLYMIATNSFNMHLRMAHWTVFADNDFWKCPWTHAAISRTESCLSLMKSCLRAQRSWIKVFPFCLLCRGGSRVSKSFYDIIWMMEYFKSEKFYIDEHYSYLLLQFSADCWAFAHLYFWETLPL